MSFILIVADIVSPFRLADPGIARLAKECVEAGRRELTGRMHRR